MANQYLQQLTRTTVASGGYIIPFSDPGSGRLLGITKDSLLGGLFTQSSGYLNLNAHSLTLNTDTTINQNLTTTSNVVFSTISGSWAGNPISSTLGGLGVDTSAAAQGSVIYKGASNWAVMGPGNSGDVLSSAGASANPYWYTPSYVLLNTATASNVASIDFFWPTGTTYQEMVIIFDSVLPATTTTKLQMVSSANGSTYDTAAASYSWSALQLGTNAFNASDVMMQLAGATTAFTNTAGRGAAGEVRVFNPGTSMIGIFSWLISSNVDGIGRPEIGAGTRLAAGVVRGVRFKFSSGNISTGNFRLYGVIRQ